MDEENKLVEERREKLNALRAQGTAFPNDFRRKDLSSALHGKFGARTKEELEPLKAEAAVAGRMVLKRVMGKASFATLQDRPGASSSMSRTTRRERKRTNASSTGTWATSSAPKARCSRPRPGS
jgi:lysyl-tRNA synthetase class II